MRIFIVENHPDTLRCLEMYFKILGHSVTTATTMQAALAAIPTQDCDVLVSDIGLPDGDGWQLMEQAQFPRPVYAVAMSGFAAESDLARSKAAGFRQHIIKPFGAEDLREVLKEAAREIQALTTEMPAQSIPAPGWKNPAARTAACLTPGQIADRLHHATCQNLVSAQLLLGVVRELLPKDAAEVRQLVEKAVGTLDEAGAELSALMKELRTPAENDSAAKSPPKSSTSVV